MKNKKKAKDELTRDQRNEYNRRNVLHIVTKLFLEKGYHATSIKEICAESGIVVGTFVNLFGCKENLMRDIVKYVLEAQFEKTEEFLKDIPHDPILMYAAETTLQLYMAESSEHIRELYSVAYSLPNTTEIIQNTITEKLEQIFSEHLPNLTTKDFYVLEIASGGIMRGFLTRRCDMWFTMENKIKNFLTLTFRIFEVPKEKIEEAIEFVSQFDYITLAEETTGNMLNEIKERI